MGTTDQQPVVVAPGSGTTLKLLGLTHKLTGAQTGGGIYVCETTFGPGRGTPLHIHHFEDELVYVMEGQIDIRLDKNSLQAPAGGVVHLPRKIPHAWRNPLEVPLRLMVYAIPGGLEHYFDEVEAALQADSLTAEIHNEISRKYGLEWLE
jgi:quercetin dioxygenase-like cupin family protein